MVSTNVERCIEHIKLADGNIEDVLIKDALYKLIDELCGLAVGCDKRLGSAYEKGLEEMKR